MDCKNEYVFVREENELSCRMIIWQGWGKGYD